MSAIQKHKLSNGLEVILVPTPGMGVVALQGWIRFGAADEPAEHAGIAHLFEHLLFKGTEKRGVGQVAKDIENLGGDVNAFTTYDCTVMHLTVGKESTYEGLEILSDAMINSIVDKDEFEREREVILEEIKRRNDQPTSRSSDLLRKHLYGKHPYARPVIGYSSVIEKITREEVFNVYKTYYNSNTIFLSIAGDFDSVKVLKQLESSFGKLKAGPTGVDRPQKTPTGPSKEFIHHTTQDAHLSLSWRIPNILDTSSPALDAVALILGQGESSRLYQSLVLDSKLVRGAGSYSWSPKDTGAFEIHFKAPPGVAKNFPKIVELTAAALEKPFSSKELEKVKSNMLAQNAYSRETVDGLAEKYGYTHAIAGDADFDEEYTKRIAKLEIEDLEKAKKEFLSWDNVVATGMLPLKDKLPTFEAPKKKVLTQTIKKSAPKHGVEQHKIGGLTILAKKVSHAPIFALRWNALGGSRIESNADVGAGSLWTRTVTEGATDSSGKKWAQKEINSLIDICGGSISSSHGKSSSGLSCDGLMKDFETLTSLACAMAYDPSFEKDIVDAEKKRILIDLKSALDSPTAVMSQMFNGKIFPKHAYGRSRFDEAQKIPKIKETNLLKLHDKIFSQNQVISFVGDRDPDKIFEYFERELGSEYRKKKLSSGLLKKQSVKHLKNSKPEIKYLDKEQSHIQLGFPTFDIKNPQRWALSGLSGILSGQGGRLFMELRDKLSLCYTVGCSHFEGIDGGFFSFYIGTSPDKEETALKAFDSEIKKLLKNGIPDEEWNGVKRYLLGNKRIEDQRFGPQATELSLTELYGLGFEESFKYEDEIKKLSAKEIHKSALKYLSSDEYKVLTIVRPKSAR